MVRKSLTNLPALFVFVYMLGASGLSFVAAATTTTLPHPFFFTENKGQWDSRVLYKCIAKNGMTWFLERDGITLLTMVQDKSKAPIIDPMDRDLPEMMRRHPARYPMKSHALKFHFISTAKAPQSLLGTATAKSVEAQGELPWHNNYFLGNDSSKWAPNCRNYTNVVYRDIWEGIDIEWYEENGRVEFDFVVQPGADPSQIRMSCDGLEGELSVSQSTIHHSPSTGAELRLPTSLGELRTVLPSVYQIESNGCRTDVPAKFEITNKNEFGVTLPDGYQKDKTLRIDPLIYSTYLGGSGFDRPQGIVAGDSGSVIVFGETVSTDFPITPGAGQTTNDGAYDCFVTRLNSTGSQLIYSTYLGGFDIEQSSAITPDGSGGVILTGYTVSSNFPTTTGAFDRSYNGGEDCFVTRLNSTGSQLIYSTYLGGWNNDEGLAIANDGNGGAFVTGTTISNNFPTTPGAFDTSGGTGFVAHLNSTGSQLIYSTFLGAARVAAVVADVNGNVFVAGACGPNFPVTIGAYDTSFNGGNDDCFSALINSTGSQLIYSTYLGGSGDDYGNSIILDGTGGVIVSGETSSTNYPTTNGVYDTSYNGGSNDCFVTHLNNNGSQIVYSTYMGGSGDDQTRGIVNDGVGGVIVTGETSSLNFPTSTRAYDNTCNGNYDCFITHLNNNGSQLLYSTYLGGSGNDAGFGIILYMNDCVTITGYTSSVNFPTTTSSFDTSNNGAGDSFVARISLIADSTEISEKYVSPSVCILRQNYPNPFNSSTTFSYSLPKSGKVKLKLFDLTGRNVKTLVDQRQNPGSYTVIFDGIGLAAGTYFLRLQTGEYLQTRKIVLLK